MAVRVNGKRSRMKRKENEIYQGSWRIECDISRYGVYLLLRNDSISSD